MASAPAQYLKYFQAASRAYGVPVPVLEGQDQVESNFDPGAVSSAGARGISQFEPGTASSEGVTFGTSPRAVQSQIMGQAEYLQDLGYSKDPSLALSKYNAGPGNPGAAGDYAAKVLAAAKQFGGVGAVSPGKIPMVSNNFRSSVSGSQAPSIFDILSGLDQLRQRFQPQNTPQSTLSSGLQSGWDMLAGIVRGEQSPEAAQSLVSPVIGVSGSVPVPSGKGDVNPLHHFTVGRTDMGVDANAAPGTPILAPNDSRVVHIYPNWYNGQPYLLLQLIAGPNKGKYYYVAEQITQLAKPGTIVKRGQPIARYAQSGTGIEIGWGTPGWQTLAQSQGNTGDSSHGNAPAGVSYRNYLHSLGT